MKKNILATFAFAAFAALGLSFPAAAAGTQGDIYSITPVESRDKGRTFKAGEKIQLRVRLLASDWNIKKPSQWVKTYVGPGTTTEEIIADAMFPPRLGVFVSGELQLADIVKEETVVSAEDASAVVFTDLICEYKVRSGDLALPMQLALWNPNEKTAVAADKYDSAQSGWSYYIANDNLWKYKNLTTGDSCQFFYADETTRGEAYQLWKDDTGITLPAADTDLTSANFLVKGIDFDEDATHREKAQDGTEHWRVVRQGKTTIKSGTIVTSGSPSESVTLYAWSEDPDVVEMAGDAQYRDFPTNREGTTFEKRWVTTIKTEEGKTEYSLTFKGVAQGASAKIVLSPILGYRRDAAGNPIETTYLTEEVWCDEPEKPNATISFSETSVQLEKTVATSTEPSATLGKSAIPVYITLSEKFASPIDVTLVITNAGNVACNPITNQNIAVSKNDYFSKADVAYTNFTLSANQTTAKVYVYPIGGDSFTEDQGLDFYLVLDDAAAAHFTERILPLNLKVGSLHAPTITAPATETDYGAQDPAGFKVPIQVADCYRELQGRPFTVTVDYSDGSSMTTNVTFKENIATQVMLTGYGNFVSYANIRVTDSVGTPSQQAVKVNFSVKPQKTVSATIYDSTAEGSQHAGEEFAEGTMAYVRFTLSESLPYGQNRWAFLVPQNEASSNLVSCGAFTKGVKIAGGETNSTLVACAITMLDGCAATDGQDGHPQYSIVLSKKDTLTDADLDDSFIDAKGLQFKVTNVKPNTLGVYVNNAIEPAPQGELWKTPVSSGVPVPFTVMATDVSAIDQTNLVSVWCITEGRAPKQSNLFYAMPFTNTTETAVLNHEFQLANAEQTVKVMSVDKDILREVLADKTPSTVTDADINAGIWNSLAKRVPTYEFNVTVESSPHIEVELVGFEFADDKNYMDERGNDGKTRVRVMLSEMVPDDVELEITLKPLAKSATGNVTFANATPTDPSYDPAGVLTLTTTIAANAYEPSSDDDERYDNGYAFEYDALNGTVGSEKNGWDVQVKVTTGYYDTYFKASKNNKFYVRNLAPTVSPAQPDYVTTNTTAELGKPFDITWTPADVAADMAATWANGKKGLKCEWYVNDIAQAGLTTYVTNNVTTGEADEQKTSITLKQEGVSVIKLVITDFDGADCHGVIERTWIYYIAPTKKLTVTPVGPGGSTTARYRGKRGLGFGRVWANGGAADVSGFSQTWSYNVKSVEATVHAYGYASAAAPYADDGTLGPAAGKYDVAIDKDGETWAEGAAYYTYDDVGYDNFFYRWARILPSENGGSPTIEYDPINPTTGSLEKRDATVVLDEYDAEKEAYATRRIEAVFAREFLWSDNCGDINGDGVPDLYLLIYPNLGVSDADGNVTGDDMQDVGILNADGDYLPNTMTAKYASFVPGLSNTWVTAGRAFTTKMEIRGAGLEALNDATAQKLSDGTDNPAYVPGVKPERRYLDPNLAPTSTLSYVEYVAYTNWCGRQGFDDYENHWNEWSPERPSDPTKADTDGDGLPDGYEYYFWYKAHVGELVEVVTVDEKTKVETVSTNLQRMTGRRYNPASPMEPFEISADDIERIFDPVKNATEVFGIDFDKQDTDNDGLPDTLEFTIGTNPVDFDTDGDGLPDGYEVSITGTDPLMTSTDGVSHKYANPDKDQMALIQVEMLPVYVAFTNAAPTLEESLVITNTLWLVPGATNGVGLVEIEGAPGYSNFNQKVSFYNCWLYDRTIEGDTLALGRADFISKDESTRVAILGFGEEQKVNAMHFQVMWFKAYDPRTGWNVPPIPEPPPRRVDTATYTTWDEFQSLAFFYQTGNLTADLITATDTRPFEKIWAECSTDPHNADTDADGMPDGWEFYVMGNGGPYSPWSPLYDFGRVTDPAVRDPDQDGLDFLEEYQGTESMIRYPDCETIYQGLDGWTWKNKLWPTDPLNGDTDGDGISDGGERTWIFGDAEADPVGFVDGGGLNPCSWDTDGDLLPDPWELEFCGTFGASADASAAAALAANAATTTNVTVSTTNATASTTNATTTTGSVAFNGDGMNPTASDAMLDYDHDGLNNWQEYMVGSMRCWRYDDLSSQWTDHTVKADDIGLTHAISNAENDDWWGHNLVELWLDNYGQNMYNDTAYNPGFRNGHFNPGVYFSCCKNSFDLNAYGKFYMFKDGVYHDLATQFIVTEEKTSYNRWGYEQFLDFAHEPSFVYIVGGKSISPKSYISCDPRNSDTDNDGMDDYYELYHGLNPLLGAPGGFRDGTPLDIVFKAYGGNATMPVPSATANYWIDGGVVYHATFDKAEGARLKHPAGGATTTEANQSEYDFYQFPWLAGLPEADPDGDNIRNQHESILPEVQAASTFQHTDPTPLWMTDTSRQDSLTHRFYRVDNPTWASTAVIGMHDTGYFDYLSFYDRAEGKTEPTRYYFNDFPWLSWNPKTLLLTNRYSLNYFVTLDSIFDYEENEGYDSDHDYLSDFEESQGKTKASSDPQDHDDPIRHQAMWFGGEANKSWLQTPLSYEYFPPTQDAASEVRQDFLFYTVEAWVKPDSGIVSAPGLFTVVERAIWGGKSGPADESFLRKNFLIGLNNGRWYTKFDSTGTDLNQPVEVTTGPVATTNWTHVVATYGPANDNEADTATKMELRLYVDGVMCDPVGSTVQPEHGLSAIIPDRTGQLENIQNWAYTPSGKPVISILVGASAMTRNGIIFDNAFEMREQDGLGCSPEWPYLNLEAETGYGDYGNFFKGYIDEVRIWDGARKKADIVKDYENRVRYTAEMAKENRQKVYEAWAQGALRSPSGAAGVVLPPELLYHWSFDHLPGATKTDWVLQSPAGFATDETVTDAKARWARPVNWKSDWWKTVKVRSNVYQDAAWTPWINNTVSHLPCIDGSTADSIYWSEDYAGIVSATSIGYLSFAFPRTAEVWSRQVQQLYATLSGPFTQMTRWNLVSGQGELASAFRFARRNRFVIGSDLLPMGGAYPKRISTNEGGMWDDTCASDAWAQTGPGGDGGDGDHNGLPTWWEDVAVDRYGAEIGASTIVEWNTTVTYDGVKMTAHEAYLRDLARGMLPDGEYHVEYADTRDTDKDGVIDYYAEQYNLMDGHAGEDDDGDGLSNYAEYLITEVFKYAKCSPVKYATDDKTCDYFLKVGDLYLGEIFTDHDHMDDVWEAKYDVSYVNRYVYDPDRDDDGDGWSNYAEFRAGTDPTRKDALSIDGYVCPEYPVPAIAANIIWNGEAVINSPIVIKAWNEKTDFDMLKAPDATWTLGVADEKDQTSGATTATSTTMAQGLEEREKFIGRKPTGEYTFYLSGGHVSEGSIKLLFLDKGYGVVQFDPNSGWITPVALGEPDDAVWYYFIVDRGGKLVRAGSTLYASMGYEEEVVGTIDYVTGKCTIDFGHEELCGQMLGDPTMADTDDDADDDTTVLAANTYHYIDLDASYVRVEWKASTLMATGSGLHYLSDPDASSDSSASFGHVREGKNTFICFADTDGDGEYTPGEPFGTVRGVDVGWSGAAFDVELTKTHPVFARVNITDGANDRAVAYGTASGNMTNLIAGGLSGGEYERVRVVRTLVDGWSVGDQMMTGAGIQNGNRVVLDKWFEIAHCRKFLHEGDFLSDTAFDLDWEYFTSDIGPAVGKKFKPIVGYNSTWPIYSNNDVVIAATSIVYRIVLGNGSVDLAATNNLLPVAVTRTYDYTRVKPTVVGTDGIVYGAHPTFRWTMNGFNSYTAFKLRITETNGTVVYESPMTRVPQTDVNGNYVWKAPFSIGDQTPQGKVLARAGNFKWSVSMCNAKYQTDDFCTPGVFSVAVGQQQYADDNGYGAVNVSVKYAGPFAVLSNAADTTTCTGMVRVQAFSGPDFSGVPESQTFVTNVAEIANLSNLTVNATLYGLKKGTYYIRAYIDSDGDFAKDEWESWGYAKSSVTVAPAKVPDTAVVWIEDADTDGDWLPDAWEYAIYGNLMHENASVAASGKIILKTATYMAIKDGRANISTTLPGATLTLFENLEAARLLLQMGSATSTDTIDAIRAAVAKTINPNTVRVTGLSLNAARRSVSLSVSANVQEPTERSLLASVYTVPDATAVTVNVYRSATLNDDWKLVDRKTVQVNAALDATFEVPVDADLTSGFYKVEVVE